MRAAPPPKEGSTVSRTSLANQAYLRLREAILRGEIPPGRPVTEADVLGMLRVSRTPIREALMRLELEGYLARDPTNHLTVHRPTRREVVENFWVRELLEVYATGLAARRISDGELADMQQLLKADRQALRGRALDNLASTNDDIHDLVLRASRNRTLLNLVRNLRAKVHGIHAFAVGTAKDQEAFVAQHAAIAEALMDGDAQQAMDLTRSHLRRARDLLLNELADGSGAEHDAVVPGENMPHLTLDLSDDPTAVLAALTSAYLDQVATSPGGWPSNPEEPR
jgi:DNA-binding GntR family transcriptional regulator